MPTPTGSSQQEITWIAVEQIVAGDNDRHVFSANGLAELAESIEANGLAQPPLVRPVYTCETCGEVSAQSFSCAHGGSSDPYREAVPAFQIVAGERRTRAMRDFLRWPSIPCIVRPLSDEEASALMLAENTDRVDLNPVEEAHAYEKRQTRFGWDFDRIARTAGVTVERVKRRLSLLSLAPDVLHLVASGNIPLAHAETMTRLDSNRQRIALRAFQASEVVPDVVMFRRLCSKLFAEQAQETLLPVDEFQLQAMVVEAAKPRQGKGADISHVPTREDLPKITVGRKDTNAIVIERWLRDLVSAGFHAEAAAVGTLYARMIEGRLMRVPYEIEYIG